MKNVKGNIRVFSSGLNFAWIYVGKFWSFVESPDSSFAVKAYLTRTALACENLLSEKKGGNWHLVQ